VPGLKPLSKNQLLRGHKWPLIHILIEPQKIKGNLRFWGDGRLARPDLAFAYSYLNASAGKILAADHEG
jgi:hypothetical protein